MRIKVHCVTPPNQAEKAEKKLRGDLFLKAGKVMESKIENDKKFYWIVDMEGKEMETFAKRAVKAEAAIRGSYKKLMAAIKRMKRQHKYEDWDEMQKFIKRDNLIWVEELKE